jgi:hypothetical protein
MDICDPKDETILLIYEFVLNQCYVFVCVT